MTTDHQLQTAISKLVAYCRANDWAGYDPYDALNSRVFAASPFLNSRLPRLLLTQTLKRSPINIRRLLAIPKTQNPKAMALFLSAFLKLSGIGFPEAEDLSSLMMERLIALRTPQVPMWCWGYSFPWQTRTVVVPAGAPNLVCTTFVGNALLDLYERHRDRGSLTMAASAAEYLLTELYWTEGGSIAGFSYPLPNLRNQVPNANFLGASFLCRVYKHTGETKFLEPALRVARHSASMQRADGSWPYGQAPSQQWIDNFHTGYNLCALKSIGQYAETSEFDSCLRRGFDFYRAHFFREDGAPKYFHDRNYPVDIHCVSQSILTLLLLKNLDSGNAPLALSVFEWAMKHMWDGRGFFCYRVLRFSKNRIPYMRWAQAWMLLAISALLGESAVALENPETHDSTVLAQVC